MEWEFSGKNVESAVKRGLGELKLSREDVEIKILDEGKAGLFGLMGAVPARIKIISDKKPDTVDWDKTSEKARELCLLLAGSVDKEVRAEVSRSGRKIKIRLEGGNSALLIGRKGATLEAISYILNLMMKRDPATRADIIVDIGDYRKKKLSESLGKFREAVSSVRNSGRSVELEPMEPSERKALHKEAGEMDDIETESRGEGQSRRVVVKKKS